MTVVGLAALILFKRSLDRGSRGLAVAAGVVAFAPMAVMYLNMIHLPLTPLMIAFQLLAMLGVFGWRDRVGRSGDHLAHS